MKWKILTAVIVAVLAFAALAHKRDKDEISAAEAARIGWSQTSEKDRDLMCLGVLLGGPGWAAKQFEKEGFRGWEADVAGATIEGECQNR